MSFDWLKDPIEGDAPCGPDLESSDDPAFLDYYYEAESRMPERYFVPGIKGPDDDYTPGTSFDPSTIKTAAEKKTITALLQRSRDLRLVSLLARMMALGGKLPEFSQAVTAMAELLEAYPAAVHPQSPTDRRSAIDELGNNAVVAIPLQHINIAGAGEVTYRRYLAATGQSEPRQGEVGLNAGSLTNEIGAPGNGKAVVAAHTALSKAAKGLERIQAACLQLDPPFTPSLGPTQKTISDMLILIAEGRSDLAAWQADTVADAAPTKAKKPQQETVESTPAPAPVDEAPAKAIANRAAAAQALTAVETYLATHEPSSSSLLLVTQARLLVGRPLVEAIETLLPEHANKTKIVLGEGTGFVLYMDRLKMLAGEASNHAQSLEAEDPGPVPVVKTRANIAPLLSAVETFFRTKEPASPIPVLLSRARALLDKDFTATVTDLIQMPTNE